MDCGLVFLIYNCKVVFKYGIGINAVSDNVL